MTRKIRKKRDGIIPPTHLRSLSKIPSNSWATIKLIIAINYKAIFIAQFLDCHFLLTRDLNPSFHVCGCLCLIFYRLPWVYYLHNFFFNYWMCECVYTWNVSLHQRYAVKLPIKHGRNMWELGWDRLIYYFWLALSLFRLRKPSTQEISFTNRNRKGEWHC